MTKVRQKEINYNDETIKNFLDGWGLDEEKNERVIRKVETGILRRIWIGCDTGHMALGNCQELHNHQYDRGGEWTTHCTLCNEALKKYKCKDTMTAIRFNL